MKATFDKYESLFLAQQADPELAARLADALRCLLIEKKKDYR